MLVDYCSDLHVYGNHYAPDWENERKGEILIVAGDTSNDIHKTLTVIKKAAIFYKLVLFVDGNHEHYSSGMTVDGTENWVKLELAKLKEKENINNIHYLTDKPVSVGNTLFIGDCGWYDWNVEGARDVAYRAWRNYSNDSRYIKTKREDFLLGQFEDDFYHQYHYFINKSKVAAERLSQIILDIDAFPGSYDNPKDIIVVTHTVGRAELLESKIKDPIWNSLNGSYHNSCYYDVLKNDAGKRIRTWVYGHSHTRKDEVWHGVRYLNNARGYPGEIIEPWTLKQFEINT